jgi:hypothetical protein
MNKYTRILIEDSCNKSIYKNDTKGQLFLEKIDQKYLVKFKDYELIFCYKHLLHITHYGIKNEQLFMYSQKRPEIVEFIIYILLNAEQLEIIGEFSNISKCVSSFFVFLCSSMNCEDIKKFVSSDLVINYPLENYFYDGLVGIIRSNKILSFDYLINIRKKKINISNLDDSDTDEYLIITHLKEYLNLSRQNKYIIITLLEHIVIYSRYEMALSLLSKKFMKYIHKNEIIMVFDKFITESYSICFYNNTIIREFDNKINNYCKMFKLLLSIRKCLLCDNKKDDKSSIQFIFEEFNIIESWDSMDSFNIEYYNEPTIKYNYDVRMRIMEELDIEDYVIEDEMINSIVHKGKLNYYIMDTLFYDIPFNRYDFEIFDSEDMSDITYEFIQFIDSYFEKTKKQMSKINDYESPDKLLGEIHNTDNFMSFIKYNHLHKKIIFDKKIHSEHEYYSQWFIY